MSHPMDRAALITGVRGFTLIELLVVLTILALTTGLAVETIGHSNGSELRRIAYGMIADMQALREAALRNQARTEFNIRRESGRSVWVTGAAVHMLPSDISAEFNSTSSRLVGEAPRGIVFFPDGSAAGGTITLRGGGAAMVVRIDSLDGHLTVGR